MSAFWFFARKMFRRRATVAWAFFFALISAGGLGVGLLSLGPMLRSILKDDSLVAQAQAFNEKEHWLTIPQGLIAKLPTDPFQGVLLIITETTKGKWRLSFDEAAPSQTKIKTICEATIRLLIGNRKTTSKKP